MAVTGDFGGLEDLRRRISAFAGPGSGSFLRRMSKNLAEEARAQVSDSFERGVDPYGRPWTPLTSRSGRPLRDTGRFMASWTTISERDFFTVSTDFVGAAVHQYGATIKPKKADALYFELEGGAVIARGRGRTLADPMFEGKTGKRLKRPKAYSAFVMAQQVTIPRRQIVPEGHLPSRWNSAFDNTATLVMLDHMGIHV